MLEENAPPPWTEVLFSLGAVAVVVGLLALFFALAADSSDRYEICLDAAGERYTRDDRTEPLIDSSGFTLSEKPAGLRCKEVRLSTQQDGG